MQTMKCWPDALSPPLPLTRVGYISGMPRILLHPAASALHICTHNYLHTEKHEVCSRIRY